MWGYKFRPQGMWGGPWGGVKCAKWAKKSFFWKMGENDEKIMKKNEKVPDFLLEMSKTILHSQHPIRKKWKNAMGLPMGVHKRVKSHFSSSVLVLAWGRGENESEMAGKFCLSVDIIAMAPSENIYVIRSEGGVEGSPISRCKWCTIVKNDLKFNFQANGGTWGGNTLE